MRKRSAEREEFLSDILCAFAEGGIQMIGEIIDKDFDADALKYNMVRVRYFDDPTEHEVTIETIATAFSRCANRNPAVNGLYRIRLMRCYREMDAGEIDAVDATNLVEIGLFGEIVYG